MREESEMNDAVREKVAELAWDLLNKKLNLDNNSRYTLTELADVIRLCEHRQLPVPVSLGLSDEQLKKVKSYMEMIRK